MKEIDPVALFRLTVLGPVLSRPRLSRGEQKELLKELAAKDYDIPGSQRRSISEKTLHEWLLKYRRQGVGGLAPRTRSDQGSSKLSAEVQERLLAAKRANPRRSIRVLRQMLENEGLVRRGQLSRSAIHRLLQQHGLSRPSGSASLSQERRSFLAEQANDIWYGDVLHGPKALAERLRKTYLVTLMDDASRLITHSAFCLSETAVDIEGVLKQAVLKRGLPTKFVVDNGAAYRSTSLQGICARLGISLVYCRPYHPEGNASGLSRLAVARFMRQACDTCDTPRPCPGLSRDCRTHHATPKRLSARGNVGLVVVSQARALCERCEARFTDPP